IYADDTGPEYGHVISPIAARLIGGQPSDPQAARPIETIMAGNAGDMTQVFPVDRLHFPIGRRTHLIANPAGFGSHHVSAHRLGLGEYCAMYLTMWSNVLWPDLTPMLNARWAAVDAYRAHTRDLLAAIKTERKTREVPSEVTERARYYWAWLLVPPED